MATRILILVAIAALFVTPAFADGGEGLTKYSCTCAKKATYKGKTTCSSDTATVETRSSNTTAKAMAGLCHTAFHGTCSPSACEATATLSSAGTTSKKADEPKKATHVLGVKNEHVDALAKYADEKDWTIIVRASNVESLPYQDDFDSYRPKPHLVLWYKTRKKGDTGLGLIDCTAIKGDQRKGWSKAAFEERQKNKEVLVKAGWKCKNGLLSDPAGKQVYSDYDLQGVYVHNKDKTVTVLDMNPANVRLDMNKAVFPERTKKSKDANKEGKDDPQQYLIQHGANDNYKVHELDPARREMPMGRLPGNDENYLVVHPDGTKTEIQTTVKLVEFYEKTLKVKWPYGKYPRDEKVKDPITKDEEEWADK